MYSKWWLRLACVLTVLGCVASASAQWRHLGSLSAFELSDTTLRLECGESVVRVEAVAEHVVRVRLAPDGDFGRDFSWAVQDLTHHAKFTKLEENERLIRVSTGGLIVVVHRDPCRLEVHDADGHVLTADDAVRGMAWQTGGKSRAVRVWQGLGEKTAIFGLGEKTGPMDKRGRVWTMWNTDFAAYGAASDPLYKSIPFFVAGNEARYHGVFFDNPWRSTFDLGQTEPDVLSYEARGGELNYYVIGGPDPKDVVRRYTGLTGRMELPPKWALGYHQCRYSYYPESRVREVAATFRQKRIPCDVLYFDIDYMDGYRCFTWNSQRFPDPKGMMDDLHAQGFHTIAIIDPGIKHEPGYAVYDSGTALGAWLTKPNGEVYVGRVWPGDSVFPDFTNPEVRMWWSQLYPPFMKACGLDGIWNDMNEPADFVGPRHSVPLDLRHANEGEPAFHEAVHNVYGMQMARATLAGLKQTRPNERPFVLTRATYAGGQRYSAGWTGDNISTWDHLRMSIAMCLNLGASGFPNVGPDIGGFVGGATPQLYARWIQAASLFPFCRTHTAWPSPDQEPWSFGMEVERISREALERRYALLPYMYTLFEESTRTGLPIIRPLWMEFPGMRAWYEDRVYLLGSDLYVVPIVQPDASDFNHHIPAGVWFDANTGLIHGGGQRAKIEADLETLPMFVRAGAIIPMQSPVQSTTDQPDESLILDVWPFGESRGALYEDDGASYAYQNEQAYRRTSFTCAVEEDEIRFTIEQPEGKYVPAPRVPLVSLHGLTRVIEQVSVSVGGQPSAVSGKASSDAVVAAPGEFFHDRDAGAWLVRMLPDTGEPQELRVKLAPHPEVKAEAVALDFSEIDGCFSYSREILRPRVDDGTLVLRLQSPWGPHLVLPRLRVDADRLPMLKLRMSAEHTKRIGVSFATEADPSLSDRSEVTFDITPDGSMREYTFDLAAASEHWSGTVYWVRLSFNDGASAGEVVRLDRLTFESRDR